MRRVVREVYGERLEAVCGDEPPEVQILYSPPFFFLQHIPNLAKIH